jgi:hypothetical protein
MTSQETDMDTLKAEAKALKVPGWQLMKDPEKLAQKIEDAKKSGGRKKAPKLRVTTSGESSRNKLIERLEKEDPDSKYMTQNSSLTQAQAQAKGLEICKEPNGDLIYCGEDIVCRTDKDSYYEWQNKRNADATRAMKSIDKDLSTEKGGKHIQSLSQRAKTGRADPD